MGWWDRLKHEMRSVILGPYATGDPALTRLFGGGPTSSGETVSVDRAAGLSAVWACVTLIAGTIATMPLVLYRRTDDGRERALEHPLYDVLHTRPNPVQPVVTFWESLVSALLLRGNGYAMLTRDDDGRVRALWYVNPDRVQVDVTKTGRLTYQVWTGGSSTRVSDANMLHVVGPMSDDGYQGRSVIATFRETLGLGLALERYGGEFFANAATPKGVLKTAARLSQPARDNLTAALDAGHAARGRRHRTLILEEGLEFQALGVSHEDSQFIEVRRFTTEEIARIFGVPPHMIGADIKGSMTYSNSELESLRLLKHTLGPWLARIASAVNHACISPLERRQMYAEYLPDALLATDTAGRYAAYKTGLEAGFLTLDEVRRKENLPALERVPAIG
jgi:HK97 family phage portal protein